MRLLRLASLVFVLLWQTLVARPLSIVAGLFWSWRIRRGAKMVECLDDWMKKAGYKRWERKQFWRDFIKSASARSALTEKLK